MCFYLKQHSPGLVDVLMEHLLYLKYYCLNFQYVYLINGFILCESHAWYRRWPTENANPVFTKHSGAKLHKA